MTGMTVTNFGIGTAAQNPTGLQLLGSASLSGASTTISALPLRTFLWVVIALTGKGAADTVGLRFNGDNAGNYSSRSSANGGADATATSVTSAVVGPISGTVAQYMDAMIANLPGVHKQIIFHNSGEIIAPTSAPNRTEGALYWDGTNQITSVTVLSVGGQTLAGTVLVYGSN